MWLRVEECYRCWWCAYRGPSQCHLGGSGKKQCSLEKSLQMVRWVEGQKSWRERVRTDGGGPIWILLAVAGGYTPLARHPAAQPASGGCGALLWPHLPLPPPQGSASVGAGTCLFFCLHFCHKHIPQDVFWLECGDGGHRTTRFLWKSRVPRGQITGHWCVIVLTLKSCCFYPGKEEFLKNNSLCLKMSNVNNVWNIYQFKPSLKNLPLWLINIDSKLVWFYWICFLIIL